LLLLGLVELLVRNRLANALIIAAALALAAGMHVQLANRYRREWNNQKAFFWQLVWRAPGIQPGTILLSAELPFTYYSDNSLTAPLNWTYAPDRAERQLSYLFFNIESRLGGSLAGFDKGLEVNENYRALHFSGTTSQALSIYYSPPGCVKIVDPSRDYKTPQKPLYFARILPLSDLSLVVPQANPPAQPPSAFFGAEPEPNWCYYYEKADLARQQENWEEVVRLAEPAFATQTQLYEVNATELLPYIEAYAMTSDWGNAQKLSIEGQRLTWRMERILCDIWTRIDGQTPDGEEKTNSLEMMRSQFKCAP
jgi:hypothetical protein